MYRAGARAQSAGAAPDIAYNRKVCIPTRNSVPNMTVHIGWQSIANQLTTS